MKRHFITKPIHFSPRTEPKIHKSVTTTNFLLFSNSEKNDPYKIPIYQLERLGYQNVLEYKVFEKSHFSSSIPKCVYTYLLLFNKHCVT